MTICFLVTLIPLILTPFNSHDLKESVGTVIGAISSALLIALATHILTNGIEFDLLENELQNIVDESKCSFHHENCLRDPIKSFHMHSNEIK